MTKEKDIRFELTAKSDKLRLEFNRASSSINKFQNKTSASLSKIKRAVFSLNGALATVGLGVGVGALAGNLLDTASSFEQLEKKLNALTDGNGAETLERINAWALDMPINTKAAVATFVKMQAMGLDPTIKKMETLVDVSAIFGKEAMPRIARALGQMHTLGKLSEEELNQMSEAGINARKYLTEAFSMSVPEIQKAGIDIDKVIKTIMTGLDRDFGGAARANMDSWEGLKATTESYLTELERRVMAAGLFTTIKSQLFDVNEELKDWVDNNSDLIAQKIPEYIKSVTEFGGGAVDFFEHFGPAAMTAATGLAALTAGQWAFNAAANANPYILLGAGAFWVFDWMSDKLDEQTKELIARDDAMLPPEGLTYEWAMQFAEIDKVVAQINELKAAGEGWSLFELFGEDNRADRKIKELEDQLNVLLGINAAAKAIPIISDERILGLVDSKAKYKEKDPDQAPKTKSNPNFRQYAKPIGPEPQGTSLLKEITAYQEDMVDIRAKNLTDMEKTAEGYRNRVLTPFERMEKDLAHLDLTEGLLDPEIFERNQEYILAEYDRAIEQLEDKTNDTTTHMSEFWLTAYGNMQDAGASFFKSMREDSDDWLDHFSDMTLNMIDQWLAAKTMMGLFGDVSTTGQLGGAVGGMAGALTSSGAEFFGNMDSSMAQSFGGWLDGLSSFDTGTEYVPQDMFAKIHRGERIIPAAQNKSGNTAGNITIINNINVKGSGDKAKDQQTGANISLAIKASLLEFLDDEQRSGGALNRQGLY